MVECMDTILSFQKGNLHCLVVGTHFQNLWSAFLSLTPTLKLATTILLKVNQSVNIYILNPVRYRSPTNLHKCAFEVLQHIHMKFENSSHYWDFRCNSIIIPISCYEQEIQISLPEMKERLGRGWEWTERKLNLDGELTEPVNYQWGYWKPRQGENIINRLDRKNKDHNTK